MTKRKKPKNWIQSSIKHPGALTKKAKAKNMSISKYCSQDKLSSTSKHQCNLAKTLKRLKSK